MIDHGVALELENKLWLTKKSGFATSTRLSNNAKHTYRIIALSTFISLAVAIYDATVEHTQQSGFFSIMLSLAAFIASLIASQNNWESKAEKMHYCSIAIDALYCELRQYFNNGQYRIEEEAYKALSRNYHHLLEGYDNHERIDYLAVVMQDTHYEGKRTWALCFEYWCYRAFSFSLVVIFYCLPVGFAFLIYGTAIMK